MFRKVLFPVVLTHKMEEYLPCVSGMVQAGMEQVDLMHVVDLGDTYGDPKIVDFAEKTLAQWKESLEQAGVKKVDMIFEEGEPWVEILDRLEKEEYSFVMVGSRGASFLKRLFVGSVAEKVLHHAKKPVLLFRNYPCEEKGEAVYYLMCGSIFERILYVTDFSDEAAKCIPYLEKMAEIPGAVLEILHVHDTRAMEHISAESAEEISREEEKQLEEMGRQLADKGFDSVQIHTLVDHPVAGILKYAGEKKNSLIVIGAKGKSNILEMVLGSVTESLIHKAPCSVFVVR
jgi:nucleotide-binding universal stress UspA family protein